MGEDHQSKSAMGEHNGSQVALVLVNSLLFLAAAAMVHLWFFPQFAGEIFLNEFRNLTISYEIPVTPNNWVLILWPIISGWLLICKLYTWVLLCRKNAVGPLYKSPPIINHWFLLPYSFALFIVVAWTIVYDRDLVIPATVLMFVAAILCWLATAALYQSVHAHGAWLAKHLRADLWLYRVLWHNGIAALTTWLSIYAINLLAITLRVEINLGLQILVYIVLGSISGIMVLWFILENTVLDRFGRYTVTHYAVILVWMVGVYDRQFDLTSDATQYFIIALLAASAFCTVVRIGLSAVRAVKCPLYMNNKVSEDPVIGYTE